MARPFDVSAEASAEVSDVLAAFAAKDYWLARLAAYGGDSMTLDSLTVAPDVMTVENDEAGKALEARALAQEWRDSEQGRVVLAVREPDLLVGEKVHMDRKRAHLA